LTIVMPVQDGQSDIERNVRDLLDVLPELTTEFEILIVDNASIDSSEEVACELSRRFPQVRVHHLRERQEFEQAIAVGMELARGEIIYIQRGDVRIAELREQWRVRAEHQLDVPRPHTGGVQRELMQRLTTWGESLRSSRQNAPSAATPVPAPNTRRLVSHETQR